MQNDIPKYLEDFLFCISRVEYHIRDIKSFNEFKDSWTIYDAVERRLAIIGEAVWQINKLDNNFKLTDKNKIIGFRHILTHAYDLVSPAIIWKIIENNLSILKEEISNYLNQ